MQAWEYFGVTTGVLVGVAVVLALATLVIVVAALGGMRRALVLTPYVLLAMAVTGVLVATLGFSVGDGNGRSGINLTPFEEIRRGMRGGASEVVAANVWGNVAMFVPIGVLLVCIWTSPLWARVIMATIAGTGLSVAIELTQLTLHRVADIDDVILNGGGALLGAVAAAVVVVLVRMARWVAHRLRSRSASPDPADAAERG